MRKGGNYFPNQPPFKTTLIDSFKITSQQVTYQYKDSEEDVEYRRNYLQFAL